MDFVEGESGKSYGLPFSTVVGNTPSLHPGKRKKREFIKIILKIMQMECCSDDIFLYGKPEVSYHCGSLDKNTVGFFLLAFVLMQEISSVTNKSE